MVIVWCLSPWELLLSGGYKKGNNAPTQDASKQKLDASIILSQFLVPRPRRRVILGQHNQSAGGSHSLV